MTGKRPAPTIFQSTRLYKPRRADTWQSTSDRKFQSTRLYKPRPALPGISRSKSIFQSTRLYKLDALGPRDGMKKIYFNPRGCISLDSKNIQKIYSKLFPNTTIIQHLLNFITIQLQYILKFHYYLQKFGANPPAN